VAPHAVASSCIDDVARIAGARAGSELGVGLASQALVRSSARAGVAGVVAGLTSSRGAKLSNVARTGEVREQVGVCWAGQAVVNRGSVTGRASRVARAAGDGSGVKVVAHSASADSRRELEVVLAAGALIVGSA
jgi:hypothetical protein